MVHKVSEPKTQNPEFHILLPILFHLLFLLNPEHLQKETAYLGMSWINHNIVDKKASFFVWFPLKRLQANISTNEIVSN